MVLGFIITVHGAIILENEQKEMRRENGNSLILSLRQLIRFWFSLLLNIMFKAKRRRGTLRQADKGECKIDAC